MMVRGFREFVESAKSLASDRNRVCETWDVNSDSRVELIAKLVKSSLHEANLADILDVSVAKPTANKSSIKVIKKEIMNFIKAIIWLQPTQGSKRYTGIFSTEQLANDTMRLVEKILKEKNININDYDIYIEKCEDGWSINAIKFWQEEPDT